ncbi:MAG TPA: Gfo/Idh/MocA family oxidoreductase [Bauldia sp.]|nr:Gfo/Idh/MocA family oxidoreductase [Bauldia sp.]
MTIRIGVIGAGIMGADHARILSTSVAGAELVAIADPDAGRRERLAADLALKRSYADPAALIGDADVDAVIVASPDETHRAYTLACLEAGKPVLCEKPLAATPADCLDIVRREVAGGRRMIQVGFMRRFDPGYVSMKRALASGELGAALILHCVHRNKQSTGYSTSEGLIANSGVHEIDISRWLLDDEVARAVVVAPRPTRLATIRDPQILILEMAGGPVVEVEIFINAQYGYDVRAELVCEKGTVSLQPRSDTVLRHAGREGIVHGDDWRGRFADAYRIELQAWIDALTHNGAAGASAWDGYAATATAAACLDALRTGRPTDIRLEDRPAFYAA